MPSDMLKTFLPSEGDAVSGTRGAISTLSPDLPDRVEQHGEKDRQILPGAPGAPRQVDDQRLPADPG